MQPCAGGAADAAGTLCWQDPAFPEIERDSAYAYCAELSLGGYEDWRLPTIDELRALVRGCPASEPGGACPVTDGSPTTDLTTSCYGCSDECGGDGCTDQALHESCVWYDDGNAWSSSVPPDAPTDAFVLNFWTAGFHSLPVADGTATYESGVRCVRDLP
jgi:hypothetical protein